MPMFTFYAAHMSKVENLSCEDLPAEHKKGNKNVRAFTCVTTDKDEAFKILVKAAQNSMRFTWINHLSNFQEG